MQIFHCPSCVDSCLKFFFANSYHVMMIMRGKLHKNNRHVCSCFNYNYTWWESIDVDQVKTVTVNPSLCFPHF